MIICSIVLFVIIIFGIVAYINELHDIEKNQNIISKFLDAAVSLINKCDSGESADKEYFEIMSDYKQADRILRVHCDHPSPYHIAYNISRNDLDRNELAKQRWNVFNYFFSWSWIHTTVRIWISN